MITISEKSSKRSKTTVSQTSRLGNPSHRLLVTNARRSLGVDPYLMIILEMAKPCFRTNHEQQRKYVDMFSPAFVIGHSGRPGYLVPSEVYRNRVICLLILAGSQTSKS